MTPVTRCLYQVDHASVLTDTSVVAQVSQALDELEGAYGRPSERVVALEAVLHEIVRQRRFADALFGRFVLMQIEQRQNRSASAAA